MSRLKKGLLRSTLFLLSVFASKGHAATPSTCTAVTDSPPNGTIYYLHGDTSVTVHVSGHASVSVAGTANEQFQCNWNMYTKCNPTPGTIGKDTSNGFVNQTCDAMGAWKRTSVEFDGYPALTGGSYTADTFATVQVGNQKTSAEGFSNFEIRAS